MFSVLSGAITQALRLHRQPVVEPGPDGQYVLGLPGAYRAGAVVASVVLSGALVAAFLAVPSAPVGRLLVAIVLSPLALFSVWAAWDALFVRLTASSSSLRCFSPFGVRELPWIAVTSVTYEPILSLFTIRGSRRAIRFTAYRHGLASLSALAWHGLPENVRGQSSVIGLEATRNTAA